MATIWQKAFSRIFWKNRPNTDTPLGESKLLPMDASIDEIDDRVVTLQQTKAEQSDFLTSIQNIEFNRQTGVFTITKFNGTTFTINTDLEKIAVNFDYDDDPTSEHYQQIILTLIDGTVKYIDLSALITQYEFTDSATIAFSVDADGKISATVIDGSITESKLQPNYLGDIRVETAKSQQYMTNAQMAQNAAETAQGLAEDAQEAAETAQGLAETAQTGAEDARDRAIASATNAGTSETNASASATQAETYADNASTSASNASTSESNASTYATNASNSATSASQSATSASDSAQDSEAWAVGQRGGVDVPSTDETYENNAKYYAEQAEESARSFPTKLSEFTNDAGFINDTVNSLVNYYTKAQTYTQSEINNLIASINAMKIAFVQALPTTDIDTHTIYFVPKQTPQTDDSYDEYINTDGTTSGWEHIGSTSIDLSNYYTKAQVDTLLADKADNAPTFTEATTRTNITSGETISTLFGKIKKFFTDLKAVAFSGSYNDLSDKPTIPTNNNQLTNGAGYITSSGSITGSSGSCTGNAATATTASNLANFENVNNNGKNANNVTYNAHTYYSSNGPATSLGASSNDGALYSQAYSASWVAQIAQDYRNGRLFVRGKNNGTWQSWLRIALLSEIPTNTNQLTNGAGFITGSGSISGSSGSCTGNSATATTAAKLGRNGSTTTPMVFYWSGKSGQPSWLWGGSDGTNMYVYNPSNFSVSYATSAGSANSVAWGDVTGKPTFASGATANAVCQRDSAGSVYVTNLGASNSSNWLGILAAATACKNYANTAYAPIYASSYPGTSARRFKENIQAMTEEEASKILEIESVTFDYKADMGIRTEEERHNQRGVIAEQVEPIIPSVVTYREEDDGQKYIYGVDYSKFVPYLIKMIQIQQKEIEELKEIIKT